MTLLETRGVRKHFGEVRAVDGVDFTLDEGEIAGIIGPNGAGKTTLVNLITGALPLDDGQVIFAGDDISDEPMYKRARRGLVRSFQIPRVCDDLTVLENVRAAVLARDHRMNAVFTLLSRETASSDEARDILAQFGLLDQETLLGSEVPHGDRKILDVCMSMAMTPRLLILDEPTSGVARKQKRSVMDRTMERITQEGLAVLFISHDMELVADYADKVTAMAKGRKLAEGTPAHVLEEDTVKQQIRGI